MKIEYNNLYTHFIFTTLHRLPLIAERHRERIEKYMTGIVNNNDSRLYAIYANPEHVHFLVSRSPKLSVSKSDIDRVCKYILNQPEHHRKVFFTEEYESFINFYQKTLHPFGKLRTWPADKPVKK